VRRVIYRVGSAARPFDAGVTVPSPHLQQLLKVTTVD
jgi:hypothetical protein